MKSHLLLIMIIPFLAISQETPQKMSGEVFKAYTDHPTEDLRVSTIVVHRSLYRISFEDTDIPERYKKAVQEFFKRGYNGFSRTGKFELKVKKREDDIYIEDRRMTPLNDEF